MKQYFVYILKCADSSYYTGVTNNLERRFHEHSTSHSPNSYTSKRLPVELVFHHIFKSILQAIAFEKQVKGWSRKKKEALINNEWDLLPMLAECKNESHYLGFDYAQPDSSDYDQPDSSDYDQPDCNEETQPDSSDFDQCDIQLR